MGLSELAYDGAEGYLLLREDTSVFDTGVAGATFVHGGNSLPERVIPVLVISDARGEAPVESEWQVEAEPQPEVLGYSCLRLRVAPAPGSLSFAERAEVSLSLRVVGRSDVGVLLRDARGEGSLQAGQVRARSGAGWVEVFFSLEGAGDEKVRVEVFHPDGLVRLAPVALTGWFAVKGRAGVVVSATRTATSESWQAGIADEGQRKVLSHLARHGSITEQEATRLLGSPMAFRRFSRQFDELVQQVPFTAKVESTADGKRYVRDREK